MSRSLEAQALALVDQAIAEYVAPPKREVRFYSLAELAALAPETDEERFVGELKRWLESGREMRREGLSDAVAWRMAGKPWLRILVGWSALTELGAAAGERGYARLAETWLAHWDASEGAAP